MGRQTWRSAVYVRDAAFVAKLGAPLLDLLAPVAGEQILDLGCGDGELTARIRESGACVTGLDASESMVAAARARGLEAVCCPAGTMRYAGVFDAVFSNAALHWMPDAAEVARRIHAALRPGGRLVAEFGGEGNVASVHRALAEALARHPETGGFDDPWYFPSASQYRSVLEAAGFEVLSIASVERPTPLPSGLEVWLRLFADHALGGLPERLASELVADIEARVRGALWHPDEARVRGALWHPDRGWVLDYVRLRVMARKRLDPATDPGCA